MSEENKALKWAAPIGVGVVCAYLFGVISSIVMFAVYTALVRTLDRWMALGASVVVGVVLSTLITLAYDRVNEQPTPRTAMAPVAPTSPVTQDEPYNPFAHATQQSRVYRDDEPYNPFASKK